MDMEYLMHGNKERKYALSLTKYLTVLYDLDGIEEDIDRLFGSSVAKYDKDALLGIHHWPTLRKNLYKAKRGFKTSGEVHSNSKIMIVKHVEDLGDHEKGRRCLNGGRGLPAKTKPYKAKVLLQRN
nr:UvrD-like helicase, ATP-binding domain, P-loop containing nucleoside triphosphate hydrolase [Tanacetum cinerariifolium]